mgnify:CR=1 FL=1
MTSLETNRKRRVIFYNLVELLVKRELKVRYRGSFLGYLWSMLNPLLTMVVLSFIFTHLMRFKMENFSLFILCGLLAWNFFHQSLLIGVNCIVNNASLLKKVKVPISLFPTVTVCSSLVNMVLALLPYFVVAIILKLELTSNVFLLPLIIIPFIFFTLGSIFLLASANVFFRDVAHSLEPVLMIAFYATPIIYPIAMLPAEYRGLLMYNPMSHFVSGFRDVLFYGEMPSMPTLIWIYSLAIGVFIAGFLCFRKLSPKFIYKI